MAKVVGAVERVGAGRTQVFFKKLLEAGDEVLAHSQLGSVLVSLVLVFSGKKVGEEGSDKGNGGEKVEEEHESDKNGELGSDHEVLWLKAERPVKRNVAEKCAKQKEHEGNVCLHGNQGLVQMVQSPVADFVSNDGNDFVFLGMVNQGIIKDDALAPRKAGKVGIRVRGALGAVNDKEFLEGKLDRLGQIFNFCLQRAVLKGNKGVEERHDDCRSKSHEKDLEYEKGSPDVNKELVTKAVDNVDESDHDGSANGNGQQLRL